MPTYGLTDDGFVAKTLTVQRDEINDALKAAFGASIDTSDGAVFGNLAGILAERLTLVWELAEQVNGSQDPNAATGAALDALCALTGTFREAAAPSTVTLTLTGTPATVVASGSQVSTSSTGLIFETTASATIASLTAWAAATAYVVGDRRTNSARAYECITAGTSAGSGGPTTTAADITDGTVHWQYLGEGTGAVDVEAESADTGAIIGAALDISVIETPVSGWSTVKNLADATLGSAEETDAALRVRRVTELSAAGNSPIDALYADLADIPDVTSVTLFVNNTDTTDADGVPPHSIEAMVQGGDDQDIADQLLASVAAGIGTYGTEAVTATDSEGNVHDFAFTRPTEVAIYVVLTLVYDASLYPSDGDAQVKQAIVTWGQAQETGKNVVASGIAAQAFSVAGVLDVTPVYIGTAPAPVASTTIPIALRELAIFSVGRISVTSSSGTP